MKRTAYWIVAALAVLGMVAVGRPQTAAASGQNLSWAPRVSHLPGPGDWYDQGQSAVYRGTDLVVASFLSLGTGVIGGSPSLVFAQCAVFHNFMPGAPTYAGPILNPVPGSYSSADVITVSAPGSGASDYVSGMGMISGPDVSFITGSNVASAVFLGGRGTDMFTLPPFTLVAQASVTQQGWVYSDNTLVRPMAKPGSGVVTITVRGSGIHTVPTAPGSPTGTDTPFTGALQCQAGAFGVNFGPGSAYNPFWLAGAL